MTPFRLAATAAALLTVLSIDGLAGWQDSAPRVSNRAAQPGEWGYRPAEGSTVRLNPPSLCWVHEPAAASYAVQWSRQVDFGNAETATGFRWNTYTHYVSLEPGTYHWRYRFTTKHGQTSDWSVARRFSVPTDAVEFPMPTRSQQRERVPQSRPRLFMRPEDLPRLRELAAGALAKDFAAVRAEADRLLAADPTPEPTVRGSARDPATRSAWWPNRVQTEKACREAETLAFVYLITRERTYGDAARRWVLHLAAWDPDGPTNFRLNCEAAKPMLYRLPRAYDWAYDTLTSADRAVVQRVLRRRALDAWQSGEIGQGIGHLNRPYSSHGNRIWHKLAECAIALLGEVPEAEEWLDYAVNKFYSCYPVWSDDDGGWHEGASYWAGYMSKVVTWLQVSRSALAIDGFKKPFFAQVGDFPLYAAPPGSPNMGFGDLSNGRPSRGWGGFVEYFLRAGGGQGKGRSPYWHWWTRQWGMTGEGGVFGFLYAANLPPLPDHKPPSDLPPSKVFAGIGVASLHTTLLDSRDDVHLLFKSSPFGSQSHGHNPQNSFQLNAYGEALLTTCVYRDLHGSKFHYEWCHSTVAQNAVLVDGTGQVKHTAAPQGRIADSRFTPELDYVAGDGTAAYAGRLARYQRHAAFVKPDLIVLYDDLAAAKPATFQFMLHALKPFAIADKAARVAVEQPKAGVVVQYLSPMPLAFRQWDGYEPKPDREFPNQWHVEASTQEKQAELGMLTVIVPHRAGQRGEFSAERLESGTAIGVRVERGGRVVVVAFRKHGTSGAATLGDLRFDGPVATQNSGGKP